MFDKDELKDLINAYYEVESSYDREAGCYLNDKWFSISAIFRLIDRI